MISMMSDEKSKQIEMIRIEQMVNMFAKSKVFADTTLFMDAAARSDLFMNFVAIAVQRTGEPLRVLASTREELNRKAAQGDLKAMMGQERLLDLLDRGLAILVASNNATFSDGSFIDLAIEKRMIDQLTQSAIISAALEDTRSRLSIITGDKKMASDLLTKVDALAGLQSVRTPGIRVYTIDHYGFPVGAVRASGLCTARPGQYKHFHSRKDAVVPADRVLADGVAPVEGDTVTNESGEKLVLGKEISFGAEAAIYQLSETTAAKIYHTVTEHRRLKVEALCRRSFDIKGVCFPVQMLFSADGQFCGFTMPLVKSCVELDELFYDSSRARYAPEFDRKNFSEIAAALAAKYYEIGRHGLALGDYNPRNVLIGLDENGHASLSKGLWLVDMDACQLTCDAGILPAQGLSYEYSAPELLRQPVDPSIPRAMSADLFAQAVLLLQIVMAGIHPFLSCGERSLVDNIRDQVFPYGSSHAYAAAQPPAGAALVWSQLPRDLKVMFQTTLTCPPEERTSTQALLKKLEDYVEWFDTKGKDFPEARTLYPTQRKQRWVTCSCGEEFDSANGGGLSKTDKNGTRYLCRKCASEPIVCEECGRSDIWTRGDVFLGRKVHKYCPTCFGKKIAAQTAEAKNAAPQPGSQTAAKPDAAQLAPKPVHVPKHAAPAPKAAPQQSAAPTPVQQSKAAPQQSAAPTPAQQSKAVPQQSAAPTPAQQSKAAPQQSAAPTPAQQSKAAPQQSAAPTPAQQSKAVPQQSSVQYESYGFLTKLYDTLMDVVMDIAAFIEDIFC